MTRTNCPYCEAEVEAEDDSAVCPECEVQFSVDWDMDGPDLSWDGSVTQTPKAQESHALYLAERAAYRARMTRAWDAVADERRAVREERDYAADAGGYYACCADTYSSLRRLRERGQWSAEERRYLDREIEDAANTGD